MTGESPITPKELSGVDFSKVDEIAFYGGTFTWLDPKLIEDYLRVAPEKPKRVSTRPDAITDEMLEILKRYNVRTVELGVESLFEDVLHASKRFYNAEIVRKAIEKLKSNFNVVVHLMTGLPGDTTKKSLISTLKLLNWGIKVFRIHPTLVFSDTELERMYKSGQYTPQPLEEAVHTVAQMLAVVEAYGGRVIRMGYHVPNSQKPYIVAGPYHPSFGDLVRARLVREIINFLGVRNVKVPKRFRTWFTSYGNNGLGFSIELTDSEEIILGAYTFKEAETLYVERIVKPAIESPNIV
ncbi:radical SAM protein [Fervidobacterium thailandense]